MRFRRIDMAAASGLLVLPFPLGVLLKVRFCSYVHFFGKGNGIGSLGPKRARSGFRNIRQSAGFQIAIFKAAAKSSWMGSIYDVFQAASANTAGEFKPVCLPFSGLQILTDANAPSQLSTSRIEFKSLKPKGVAMTYTPNVKPVELKGALSRKHAAAYCSISTRLLDKLASEGRVPRCKLGSRTFFITADLDSFLYSCRQTFKGS